MNNSPFISIIGGSIWGNRGAEAMLLTVLGKIRDDFPNAKFAIFTPYPVKDQSLVIDSNLSFFDSKPIALIKYFINAFIFSMTGRRSKLTGAVEAIQKSKVLVDIGGITFADGRLIFLPYNILTIYPAMLVGTPVVKLSQAAGSFKNPIIRFFANIFLRRCHHIFGRGEKTIDYLENQLTLPKDRFSLATDVAFLYSADYNLSTENEIAVQQLINIMDKALDQEEQIISIAPSMLVQEKSKSLNINYCDQLLQMVQKIDAPKNTYIVFPNASREKSNKKRNNDIHSVTAMRLKAKSTLHNALYKRFIWIDFDINSKTIREIVKRSTVLVTSRFHAMISGLALCTPTLVIGWGHKYFETMKMFDFENFVVDYRKSETNLSELLQYLIDNNLEIRSQMNKNLPPVMMSTQSQFKYLKEIIEE